MAARLKLTYVLPNYDENTATHHRYLYDFLDELSGKTDLFLIIEKANSTPTRFKQCQKVLIQKQTFLPWRFIELLTFLLKGMPEGYRNLYIHYSYLAVVAAHFLKIAFPLKIYYWNCGEMWLYRKDYFQAWCLKLILRLTDYLVTGSQNLAIGYQKHYRLPSSKIKVLPNWVQVKRFQNQTDLAQLKQKWGISNKFQQLVLFVHRLAPRKGAHFLPLIAKQLPSDCCLIIAGDGPLKTNLMNKLQQEKLNNVYLLGEIANTKIPQLFQMSSVFIMPSLEEGFPHVLLESMAAGIPYVATKVGAVSEITPPVLQPYLCNPNDLFKFISNLKKLLRLSKNTVSQLRQKLFLAANCYNQTAIVFKFIQLFS